MQNLIVTACHKAYEALPEDERTEIRKPGFEAQSSGGGSNSPPPPQSSSDQSGFNGLINALVQSAGGENATSTDYHNLSGSIPNQEASTDVHTVGGVHGAAGTSSDPQHAFVSGTPHSAVFLDETHSGRVPEFDRAFPEQSAMSASAAEATTDVDNTQRWSQRLDAAISSVAERLSRPGETTAQASPFGAVDMSELSELVSVTASTHVPMEEEEEEDGTVFSLDELQELVEDEPSHHPPAPAQYTVL